MTMITSATSSLRDARRLLPDAVRAVFRRLKRMLRGIWWRIYPLVITIDLELTRWLRHQEVKRGVVVSLTSYPARLPVVHTAIRSVLRGSQLPERILLWLPAEQVEPGDLPVAVRRLRQHGVAIEMCRPNFRSANKLVHALRRFPESRVVTIDDDTMYPKRWLENLVAASDENPGAVVAYRAHRVTRDSATGCFEYERSMQSRDSGIEPQLGLLPTGCSGVLYPPDSLDQQVMEIDTFRQLTPTGDDIWFRAMGLIRGTPVRRVRATSRSFPEIASSQAVTLAQINNERRANEEMLNAVAEHYQLDFTGGDGA